MTGLAPGSAGPLGATFIDGGLNFAIWSASATAVDLCLFEDGAAHEHARLRLPGRTGDVWHGHLAGGRPGQLYGYRIDGPYRPAEGHRCNPNKLLIDPYARRIHGRVAWDDATFGFDPASPDRDLAFDRRDSAPFMPRCVAAEDIPFDWGDDRPPRRPWRDTVIYEAHVKGLTCLHPDVLPEQRGTYEALGHPAIVAHLRRLGVTALELLPIHAFCDDRFMVDRGLTNYWGYSTLAFFAPESRYLGRAGPNGLKQAVKALHAAGIEVILDVVYNHTAELEETGPTLSFRGIDNASYYKAEPGDPRRTYNCTGCGNALDVSHPAVTRLVRDSLHHWVEEYRIDGFRFDLAATLARNPYGFDPLSGFLAALRDDPVLADVKLIAEPWDIGDGGYRLGQFPSPWADWNDKCRNAVRGFWRGDPAVLPDLARAISGSREIMESGGRGPLASVNYVCSHDGFTLHDLVSYEERHNLANGEQNRDGDKHNLSWNCGVEGPSSDPAILALRARQTRNLLTTLMLSQGVPMLAMGDELSRSQGGNNNPYCQDNRTNWLDWEAGQLVDPDLPDFVAELVELRRTHDALRRDRFFTGTADPASGRRDILWLAPDGREMRNEDWQDPDRRVLGLQFGDDAPDGQRLLVLINGSEADITFRLLPELASDAWVLAFDTRRPDGRPETVLNATGQGGTFTVEARSVVLFRHTHMTG